MMLLRQPHVCFLLTILLLFCTKPGKAFVNEEKDISVSADWKRIVYTNDNIEKAIYKITFQTGIKNRQNDTKTLVATHSAGINIGIGDKFNITKIEVSYTFQHENTSTVMSENEIYSSRSIETITTVPPRSTLTKWELIIDVAGTKIGYSHYIDKLNDTHSTPHTLMIRGKARVRRRINYGHTRIRIKHFRGKNVYVTVIQNANWPAATLGHSDRYLFILCKDSRGLRIRTLNTTHPGYMWAYASRSRLVYFDWHHQIGDSYESDVDKQHWTTSKNEPHFDGDVVTFKNKYYDDCAMGYMYNPLIKTNVYCKSGVEDRWVLEAVNVRDYRTDCCN